MPDRRIKQRSDKRADYPYMAIPWGEEGSTPAGTRTRAHGLGNRCSIRLSYRGKNLTITYLINKILLNYID